MPALRSCNAMTAKDVVNHIRLDEQGRAWIDYSNVKVIEIARDHVAKSWLRKILTCRAPVGCAP